MMIRHALFCLLAACVIYPLHAAPFERQTDDFAREIDAARQQGKLLAVLFELEDCPNCRELKAEVLSKSAANAFEQHFHTVSLTVDQQGNITTPSGETLPRDQWAGKLGVFATPAFGFFDGKGQYIYRHLGTLSSPEELVLLGRYIVEQAFEDAPWSVWRDAQSGATAAIHDDGHAEHDGHAGHDDSHAEHNGSSDGSSYSMDCH
ncbi:MAG: thioredoxin fold domain-containing protein [Azoarcus sp.]|jgi:protein SCO1/2|nr:thioredoxin fold domain-containing protein [Azoarcus sp.]